MKILSSKSIQYARLLSKSLIISAKCMSLRKQHLHAKLLFSEHVWLVEFHVFNVSQIKKATLYLGDSLQKNSFQNTVSYEILLY